MKYHVTCLTPTLVGDGAKLSPIDYMVWKDHVNVLDQHRIFRLLARGPRLEGYLSQLKRADKLDFASWGGFAQNYAGRRIPFEHASSSAVWERTQAEHLFIPTFATGTSGPYLPASALKGAIRSALVGARAKAQVLKDTADRLGIESRTMRQVTQAVEDSAVGPGGSNAMRLLSMGDSSAIPVSALKVYLMRVSTLEARGSGRYEVAWKQSPRGAGKRPEDGTPLFAEMASPGTVFQGQWQENAFLAQPEIARALRAKDRPSIPQIFQAINAFTAQLLQVQSQYAEWAGLPLLRSEIATLEAKLSDAAAGQGRCVLALGWGAGFFSKTAFLDTREPEYRKILAQMPFYAKAIQSNLPFPKTRKVIFLQNQPAALPGFVEIQIS